MRVLLAPVGAGKTQAALERICETLTPRTMKRVWVLLPTRRQEDAFRQRIIDYPDGQSLYFNIEFFNFFDLYRRILNESATPAHLLSEAARFRILKHSIAQQHDQLEFFGAIALKTGFVRVAADFIYELKQNLVTPEAFSAAASTAKDRDLARIYTAYHEKLRADQFVDREGEAWLAVARMQEMPQLPKDVALLVVDGFDQFSPVQAQTLGLLAGRVGETLVTLTTVPERVDTVGRRFRDTLALLTRYAPIEVETRTTTHPFNKRDIQHLTERIFLVNHPQNGADDDDGVRFIEAPDPAGEVAAVLREIKRLLLDGVPPESILVALRDWENYHAHFRFLQRDYNLPLVLHHGEVLTANPCITALFDVLDLHAGRFRRREVLAALKSPYINAEGLDDSIVHLLDVISQRFLVIRGRDEWRSAILSAARPSINEHGDEEPPILADESAARELWASLEEFFDAVTPPPDPLPIVRHIAWIEALIGADHETDPDADPDAPLISDAPYTLHMIAALRREATAGGHVVARDIHAMSSLKMLLRTLLAAYRIVDGGDLQDWDTFYAEMRLNAEATRINAQPNRGGHVLVTTATDARGLPHDYVFVLGLSEGIFPAPTAEDPLYLDTERAALNARGVTLRQQSERAADDGMFFELISLPRQRLTLSRPTVDAGEIWQPSHLWRAAIDCFKDPNITRMIAGEVVPAESAASQGEALLAVASQGENAGAFGQWLATQRPDLWTRISENTAIETRRLTYSAPYDHYSGRIHDAALRQQIADKLTNRTWSASQLNDYAASPYKFFARRLLKLEALEEPEEGMNVLQRGSVAHELLERVYKGVAAQGIAITAENLPHAHALLKEHRDQVFASAPHKYGFRVSSLWPQECDLIASQIDALITADFNGALMPKKPALFEGVRQVLHLEYDLASTAIIINGTPITLRGKIDRIDAVDSGLIVIDYKSGSRSYDAKMDELRDFQMLVYMRALEIATGQPVIGGMFWSIGKASLIGTLRADDSERQAALTGQLAENMALMQAGEFIARATKRDNGKCDTYCEFVHLCRLCATPKHYESPLPSA